MVVNSTAPTGVFAPVLLFGLWGGVVADRYNRRTLLLWTQSLYAAQALLLTIMVLSGHAPLWLLYVLSFALGSVFTVENPARLSFVTELVGRALIPKAAGLNILSLNAARLIGPAIAGVLIDAIGAGWVFAVIGWISQHAGVRWGLAVGAVTAVVSAVAVALWLTRRSPSRLALAAPTRRTGELPPPQGRSPAPSYDHDPTPASESSAGRAPAE